MNGTVLFRRTTTYDTENHTTQHNNGLSAYYTKQELYCTENRTRTGRYGTGQDGTTTHEAQYFLPHCTKYCTVLLLALYRVPLDSRAPPERPYEAPTRHGRVTRKPATPRPARPRDPRT